MRTLFTFAVMVGFLVGAAGPLFDTLSSIDNHNDQIEHTIMIATK